MEHALTVMGDSIAVGLGDPVPGYPDLPWADQLAAMLAGEPGAPCRNLGAVGARLDEIVGSQLHAALRPSARVTVLTGGGNDILGREVDWGQLHERLDLAVGELRAVGSTVVTFGLLDVSSTGLVPEPHSSALRRRIQQLNELTSSVTAHHGGCFVDFFDEADSAALFSADGLHPNRRAHRLIATRVHEQLVGIHQGVAQR